jgi:hypothetical protein
MRALSRAAAPHTRVQHLCIPTPVPCQPYCAPPHPNLSEMHCNSWLHRIRHLIRHAWTAARKSTSVLLIGTDALGKRSACWHAGNTPTRCKGYHVNPASPKTPSGECLCQRICTCLYQRAFACTGACKHQARKARHLSEMLSTLQSSLTFLDLQMLRQHGKLLGDGSRIQSSRLAPGDAERARPVSSPSDPWPPALAADGLRGARSPSRGVPGGVRLGLLLLRILGQGRHRGTVNASAAQQRAVHCTGILVIQSCH